MSKKLSIIVPSYNSRGTIGACLRSLASVARDSDMEVMVIDSSSDGTDAFIQAEFPFVRLHHVKKRTFPGPARNIGARLAESDLLAFLDADCVAKPDWATSIVRVFEAHPDESACVGCVENDNPDSWVSWVSFITEFNGYLGRQKRRPITALPTFSTVYRRDVFERYGGFPEDVAWLEDMIFCAKLVAGGERLFIEPSIRVSHHNREELGRFLHHQRRLGQFFAHSRFDADLPGSHALRISIVSVPVLTAWRGLRAYQRSFYADPAIGLRLTLLSPLYLLGSLYWMAGVFRGRGEALQGRKERGQ